MTFILFKYNSQGGDGGGEVMPEGRAKNTKKG